ncbi:hypothetical protein C3L33_01547, partial [Rhododendron williamsianum]
MTAIEEMAGMDVLCSDKTGTLTLNKLTVDRSLIEVFARGVDADTVVVMAARASRVENQDAIDTAIVGTLADPKEIYAVSITIRIVVLNAFSLLGTSGTIMTISKDRVKPSPQPDSWKLAEIFTTGVVLGGYLAMMTVIFFWAAYKTDFFPRTFGVSTLQGTARDDFRKLASAVYLQVSIISQALIFVTRSRSWSFIERPGLLLLVAFLIAQLIATLIAVYANWSFAAIEGIGWGWAGVIWLFNIVTYFPLDVIKFAIRYALSGKAWDLVFEQRIAFTGKRILGKKNRSSNGHMHRGPSMDCNLLRVRRRLAIAVISQNLIRWLKRQRDELRLPVVKLKGLDIDTIQQAYTV